MAGTLPGNYGGFIMAKSISINTYRGVDFSRAHSILRAHYDLGRALTTDEIKAEIDSLIRKHSKRNLDYVGEHLYSRIFP